jgi:hypothetical protein
MSDIDPGPAPGAEDVAPADTGGQGEAEATPEPQYLDSGEYGNHLVRVKIDGEERAVPLSEAIGGYSRQEDYTRKTQALAEQQRQAQFAITLAQALESNPQETLRILQSQYAQQEPEPEPDWTDDPIGGRLAQYEQRLARWEEQQASNELREAVGFLQARYGDDFNPQEVVQRAAAQNRLDLEAVYKEIAFDRYWQGQQAANQVKLSEEQERINAKTQAGNVHSGTGATNTVAPETGSFPTLEDAFMAAKRSLGMS